MRLAILGADGQLGLSLRDAIEGWKNSQGKPSFLAAYADIQNCDITDWESLKKFLDNNPSDIIINCAAFTNVDKAESEYETAEKVNAAGVANIARAAAERRIRVIHISTDYVFDGERSQSYLETDSTNPRTVYGKTKLLGESFLKAAQPDSIIIRTAWLYSQYGKNFFLTMRKKAMAGETVRVVADQKGTPTSAADLASAIMEIVSGDWHPGLYHFTDEGEASWYDFAREIYRLSGADPGLVSPTTTEEFAAPADRPRYSVLDKTKIKRTFGIEIPNWRYSLKKLTESIEKWN